MLTRKAKQLDGCLPSKCFHYLSRAQPCVRPDTMIRVLSLSVLSIHLIFREDTTAGVLSLVPPMGDLCTRGGTAYNE